jgi:hypothetical protein
MLKSNFRTLYGCLFVKVLPLCPVGQFAESEFNSFDAADSANKGLATKVELMAMKADERRSRQKHLLCSTDDDGVEHTKVRQFHRTAETHRQHVLHLAEQAEAHEDDDDTDLRLVLSEGEGRYHIEKALGAAQLADLEGKAVKRAASGRPRATLMEVLKKKEKEKERAELQASKKEMVDSLRNSLKSLKANNACEEALAALEAHLTVAVAEHEAIKNAKAAEEKAATAANNAEKDRVKKAEKAVKDAAAAAEKAVKDAAEKAVKDAAAATAAAAKKAEKESAAVVTAAAKAAKSNAKKAESQQKAADKQAEKATAAAARAEVKAVKEAAAAAAKATKAADATARALDKQQVRVAKEKARLEKEYERLEKKSNGKRPLGAGSAGAAADEDDEDTDEDEAVPDIPDDFRTALAAALPATRTGRVRQLPSKLC